MQQFHSIHQEVFSWFEKNGRHNLPWRQTNNIYYIYLSETMLQQTQVERVKNEYYPQFLEKFPTLKDLAQASLDEVLSAWSGLGYYRRAKNLYACANECLEHFDATLPQEYKTLLKLPGIGKYTASAICSFGYEQNVVVVDTNIARVIKRFFGLVDAKDALIWQKAQEFLPHTKVKEHNLALMDLGAMVCLPKNPKCCECPLQHWCQGKENPHIYTQTKKKEYIAMELFFGVCIQNNKVALHYSKDNMYHNMLVLPNVEPIEENFLGSFKHSYTKYKLDVKLYEVDEIYEDDLIWVDLEEFESLPISSLTKKAYKIIQKRL